MAAEPQQIFPNAQVVRIGLWQDGIPAVVVRQKASGEDFLIPEREIRQSRPANRLASGEHVEVIDWSTSVAIDVAEALPAEDRLRPAIGQNRLRTTIEQVRTDPDVAVPVWHEKPPMPEQTTGLVQKVSVPRDEYMRLLDSDRRLKNLLTAIKQTAGSALEDV